ncbi:MAG TPA: leucine-rich repeat protein [Verrucomicrobiae bacterium]|nr:leucine-rich repeat protein [Verrucomicrobiae bacterium]
MKGTRLTLGRYLDRTLRFSVAYWILMAGAAVAPLVAVGGQAEPYRYEELYSFRSDTDGYGPQGALVQGSDGNFYGTTYEGGQPTTNCPACGYGTVFRITPHGVLTTIAWFDGTTNGYPTNYGEYPFGAMLQATDGNFYGDSEGGLFKVTPGGVLTPMPGGTLGDPIQGTNGDLYSGNPYYGLIAWYSLGGSTLGSVYPSGTPSGGLVQASDGNLYGLTSNGGANDYGSAYKLTPGGVLTTLVSFGTNSPPVYPPIWPYGKLLQASDGNLYGVAGEDGTIFRLTLGGVLSNLVEFGVDAYGQNPNGGLIEANDGNFYGTTAYGGAPPDYGDMGTVFRLSPQGEITTIITFTGRGPVPGSNPLAGLIQGADGNLYGTCAYGGSRGGGNVFRIIMAGPRLGFSNVAGHVVLSWRTNYVGYTLQTSEDLTQWVNWTNHPVVSGGLYLVTTPATGGAGFFRLIRAAPLGQPQLTWITNNGAIALTGYSGPGGSIALPSTIDGLPVTTIADNATFRFSSPASLTVPNGITSIGAYAFLDAVGLAGITLPNSVTNIGESAFSYCWDLSSITLPSSLTSVPNWAFYYCTILASVTLPNSVTNIGQAAFTGCSRLTGITLPTRLRSIGVSAFSDCTGLTSVTIPDGVTSIGDNAFEGCSSLAGAVIGNGVRSTGNQVFLGCSRLANVTIGNAVTNVGFGAFISCTNLGSIAIPDSVNSIGSSAFLRCSGLTNVTFGNGLVSVWDEAFFGCTSLVSVVLPNTVTTITIGAFSECPGLTNIIIGSSLASLGSQAFSGCTHLTSVYFKGNAPSADYTVFGGDPVTVYYLPGTSGWTNSFASVPTAPWVLPYPLILTLAPGFGVSSNGFGFTISWATNRWVVVEACASLSHPAWQPLQTSTLSNGVSYFHDPAWTAYPMRVYRVRSP